MTQVQKNKSELLEALQLKNYVFKENCRVTLKLRELEQGYNNGRVVSVRKQYTQREQFLEKWSEVLLYQTPQSHDDLYGVETEQEQRLRKVKPMYRLMMGVDPKVANLANRIKQNLEQIGVSVVVPEDSKHKPGVRQFCDRVLQGILIEIFQMYYKTVGAGLEDGYDQFHKMSSFFFKQQGIYTTNAKTKLIRSKSNQGTEINIIDVVKVRLNDRPELYQQMVGLMSEVESQMGKIMSTPLRDENDSTQPIYEWQYFDEMNKLYEDPLDQLEKACKNQDGYNPDLIIPNDIENKKEEIQPIIMQSREEKNYVQEFYDKFNVVLTKISPEFWTLMVFDILKDLCDPQHSNRDLEIRFFEQLQKVEPVKYLLIFRKEIVSYLSRTKFWDQPKVERQQKTNHDSTTNHQVLKALGMSESQVADAYKVGLRSQDLGGRKNNKKKEKLTQEDGIAVHDPKEYTKMDQTKLLKFFPTSTRDDKLEYLKIRIDPIPRLKPLDEELKKVDSLPSWIRKAFEGTQSLNIIQSRIFEKAFNTEENILVCAPTGAGKTNIALLTILQEVEKHINKETLTLNDHNFKIVYISPMKALASEIVEKFSSRLKYLGVKVREYTGDMQLSKKELQETHVILTTPEKWDVVTRKTNSVSDQLQLLIIDEIHLLNDSRGPILECVVARTLNQVERAQRLIRMVGLSATLPNYWDVAVFLQVRKEGVFFFDQTYRPVPLCQKFVGVKDPIQRAKGQRRKKVDIYNEVAYDILTEVLKHGKQVLVFVHSRKETVNYSKFIVARYIAEGHQYLYASSKKDYKTMSRLTDSELNKLLPQAVAFHHAGMLRADRNVVERLFLEGDIKVLVATATLAWGVNLPAFAVIIKGTDVFDTTRADMQNLGVLDVQQMFGRAGRPQFDNQGEATLITDFNNVGHYLGMLNNASYIESKLMGFLKEALNAEIVLGNISNYSEAYNWINQTFFSIRLKRNPQNYGVSTQFGVEQLDCDFLVEEKITKALSELDDLRLVRFDTRNQMVVSTELGRIASHYYIKCETMKILCEQMGIHFDTSLKMEQTSQLQNKYQYRSMFQLLRVLAKAKEFEILRVRPEEITELKMVFLHYWIFEEKPQFTSSHSGQQSEEMDEDNLTIETEEKVMALISGYIAQLDYDNYALVMDTHVVIQNAIRLGRCMLEMAIKKNQAQMVHVLLRMCKLIENRMSEGRTPLAQFSKEIFSGYNSRKRSTAKDGFIPRSWLDVVDQKRQYNVQDFMEMDANELSHMLNIPRDAVGSFKKFCRHIPSIDVEYNIRPIAQSILQVTVYVTPNWQSTFRWHMKSEPFWIFVDNEEELLYNEEFLIQEKNVDERLPVEVTFYIPYTKKSDQYRLTVVSDRWFMREEYQEPLILDDIIIEQDLVDFTDLLDLQPLSTRVLGKPEYERLYPFQYFNPIQTQVFHSLFHTDDNVLIGSPTGSGKTIMAEFAMFRVFFKYPDKKIIYIAPMKALAKERLKDWVKRLMSNKELNKSVLELTGDYTPDLEALMAADVLITTPEKWDGISRSWANRTYVSQSALIIFDEIHLLGQDRGPVLEVIVSRMNLIASKTGQKTRMIGLSTAMANGSDVGDWFGVKQYRFYNFKPSVRPVPITIHFNGFPERAYCPRMATMNKPCFQDIKRHSDGKPVIIFVSSRRQTRLTAMDLIALQVHEHGSGSATYLKCPQWEIETYQEKAQDEYLKQTLGFGIGMHHAGLTTDDRNIIEELFVSGKIQILVATSTLAWGVNFPARLVIIKGTEFYDPKLKKYVDMPVTDILQMIGRAGRPQYDTQATACVYVEQSKKDFYRKYLNNPFPIESSLLTQLPDHINAEISSGTITNRQQCVDWITWTYFFRRLMKNPAFYGIQNNQTNTVKEFLLRLVDQTLRVLQATGSIKLQDDHVEPTFLGTLTSFYYIKHETTWHYYESLKSNSKIEELIRILSYSKEFELVPMRHNEDNMNDALSKISPLKFDPYKLNLPQEKTFLLYQAHLFNLPVPIRDYVTDTKLVIDSSIRMIHAMVDLSAEKGFMQTTLNLILILQMIVQGMWFTGSSLVNVPHFDSNITKQLQSMGITQLCELVHLLKQDKPRLKDLVKKHLQGPSKWQDIEEALNQVPIVDIKINVNAFDDTTMEKNTKLTLKEGGESIVTVNLFRQNHQQSQRVLIQKLAKIKDAGWWLCLGMPQEDKILALKKVYFRKNTKKDLQIQLPERFKDAGDMYVYLLSDSYMGLDQQIKINYK